MRVIAWSPNLTKERAEAAGVGFARTKEELLKQADLFSIHMVLAPSTTNLITKADLALLKPTALFFNTSRGPIVNESDLIEMLSEGKIAGAGLDVYDIEPLPLGHPLRKLKNVVLTPHNAYVSDDCYKVRWTSKQSSLLTHVKFKAWWQETADTVTTFVEGGEINPRLIMKAK